MSLFEKVGRAAALSDRMNEKIGAGRDQSRSPEAEALSLRTRILRCAACRHHDACAELMAGPEPLTDAPGFCRNKAELDRCAGGGEADRRQASSDRQPCN